MGKTSECTPDEAAGSSDQSHGQVHPSVTPAWSLLGHVIRPYGQVGGPAAIPSGSLPSTRLRR